MLALRGELQFLLFLLFWALRVCRCANRTVMEKSLEALSARADFAERMADFLHKKYSETVTDLRKRKLAERVRAVDGVGESLEKRPRDLEGRNRDLLFVEEDFGGSKRARSLSEEKWKKIEAEEERLRLEQEKLAERKKNVDVAIDALDARIKAVEEKEEEFKLFVEGKSREIALKEEKLENKLKEFAEKVKLADERFMERIELAERKLDGVRVNMDEKFREIQFRGNVDCESLALSVKEADLIRELVEKKVEELEKRKQEFNSYQEEKTRGFTLKERRLDMMSKQLVEDAELRSEQLMEREKLAYQLLERLQLAKDNVEGLKITAHERLEEIGLKTREMASKEQLLNMMSEQLVKDAELRSEQLMEREKLVHQLLERLQLAKDNVEELKRSAREKVEEIGLKMREMASEEQLLNMMSKELVKDAELRNKQLIEQEKSVNQLLEKLDAREKNLCSCREFTSFCFKEHLATKRKLKLVKDLLEKVSTDLAIREEHLNHAVKEFELRETN